MKELFTTLQAKYTLDKIKQIVKIEAKPQTVMKYQCSSSTNAYDIIKKDNYYNINAQTRPLEIIFTFLKQKLKINAYGIESTMDNSSNCRWSHPSSWCLYGLNRYKNWVKISSKSQSTVLNDRGKLKWFSLPKPVAFFSYKLIITENAIDGWLGVSGVDFNGRFISYGESYYIKPYETFLSLFLYIIALIKG